ncbi:MAG: sugar phosphate isomerase/epimerase [Bacillota bacterium]|nr:sugar phosphate isomerase/epimerase [Bacillota bacterium]
MERFMIGQFGKYNRLKQQRDFRSTFYGVEATSIESEVDILSLAEDLKSGNYKLCVHFPLRAGKWRLRDPQYLSKDPEARRQSYQYMNEEFEYIKDIGVHYVLIHYPKPVLLDPGLDRSNWRFSDETEYCDVNAYSDGEFLEQSEEFFKFFTDMSERYNFTPVIEFDALNRYIYENHGLINLLEKYPRLRVCLDIARLHLQDKTDPGFDGYKIARQYARFAEVIHLSNVKVDENLEKNHYPALRNLAPEDGWADVEAYLGIINNENSSFKVLFEHRSDLISDEQLEDCYRWINEILEK